MGRLKDELAEKFDRVNDDDQANGRRHDDNGPQDRDKTVKKIFHMVGEATSADGQVGLVKKFLPDDPHKRQVRRETVHFVLEFVRVITADGFGSGHG